MKKLVVLLAGISLAPAVLAADHTYNYAIYVDSNPADYATLRAQAETAVGPLMATASTPTANGYFETVVKPPIATEKIVIYAKAWSQAKEDALLSVLGNPLP